MKKEEEDHDELDEKMREMEIQIIEYEDDINQLKSETIEYKLQANNFKTSNLKYQRRVKELNQMLHNVSHEGGDLALEAAKSIREADEMKAKVNEMEEDKAKRLEEITMLQEANASINLDSAKNLDDDLSIDVGSKSMQESVSGAVSLHSHQGVKDQNTLLKGRVKVLEK